MKSITDTERMDWLESHSLPSSIVGGSDDGADAKFWGIGAHSGTLRETIDHMILTGSERQIQTESDDEAESTNTPMPRLCQVYKCTESPLTLSHDGFMVCPQCGASYGKPS